MSKIEIEIPDDEWFIADKKVTPKDKQLCLIIYRYGDKVPGIVQYRKSDWLNRGNDYFLCVDEKWYLDSVGVTKIGEWNPTFANWNTIDRWKPLILPEDVNERILRDIEGWFE